MPPEWVFESTGIRTQFFATGGNAQNDQWNVYGLAISDPPASYWLNNGASQHAYVDGMDYTFTVVARGGSTLTLSASSTDNLEAANRDQGGTPVVIPNVPPAPQAFDGQFVQIDVVKVGPAK